jgi:hypothetical protein
MSRGAQAWVVYVLGRGCCTLDYAQERDPSFCSPDAGIFSLLVMFDDETYAYVAQRDSLLQRCEAVFL